jgi:hypothetical protein
MGLIEATAWGLLGGVAAALIALSAAIAGKGYRLPPPSQRWPRLIVAASGLVVGAVVAGSAHAQLAGEWPALIMGASAPSVLRGVLGRVEVEVKTKAGEHHEGQR